MEQSKITSFSHQPIKKYDDKEREVCEILLNLKCLFKRRSNYLCANLPKWGAKGRRSAINLSPRRYQPKKKVKIGSFYSDEKTQLQSTKKVIKKRPREELFEKINELTEARESLTKEIEKVKSHHKNLIAYNIELKAKKQELHVQLTMPFIEPKTRISSLFEFSQNNTLFPKLLDNHGPRHPHFLNLIEQQQQNLAFPYHLTQAQPYSSPSRLPDLNVSVDQAFDMGYSQPLDQNVRMVGYSKKAITAEARKRRMLIIKGRKLNC